MTVNIHNFEVGSMVEVPVAGAGYTRYGVIRWIGNVLSINKLVAGLELVRKLIEYFLSLEEGKGSRLNLIMIEQSSLNYEVK